jgi:hypothetical protein
MILAYFLRIFKKNVNFHPLCSLKKKEAWFLTRKDYFPNGIHYDRMTNKHNSVCFGKFILKKTFPKNREQRNRTIPGNITATDLLFHPNDKSEATSVNLSLRISNSLPKMQGFKHIQLVLL